MAIIIDFQSKLIEKRNDELIESIPDRIYKRIYDIQMMPISEETKTEKWSASLVKEALSVYKYRDIYKEVFEDDVFDQMQYC